MNFPTSFPCFVLAQNEHKIEDQCDNEKDERAGVCAAS